MDRFLAWAVTRSEYADVPTGEWDVDRLLHTALLRVFRSKARAEAELQRLNAADPDERHLYSVRETEVEYSLWEPEVEGVD